MSKCHSLKIFCGFVLLILVNSCAFVYKKINNTGSDTIVEITSNIESADVFDTKQRKIGTTPLKVDGTKKENKTLTIEKEGYNAATLNIETKEMKGFAFLDALFLGIPYIVDISSKAIYTVEKKNINVILKKKFDPKAANIPVIVKDVMWDVNDGSIIGKEDKKEDIYFKRSFFNTYIYRKTICNELSTTAFRTYECENYNPSGDEVLAKPGSIYIQPLINKLNLDIDYKKGIRRCAIHVSWKFMASSDDFLLKEVTDIVNITSEKTDNKWVIAEALALSAVKITQDEKLFAEIVELRKNTNMKSFDATISINKVKRPQFLKQKDLIKQLMEGVVTIETENGGHGSGFFISEDGYIITNQHVVKKQKTVNVRLGKSMTIIGEVVRVSEGYDLALIKVSGKGFVPISIGNSDSLEVGEDVLAIGTPEDVSLGQSVTKGIVSGRRKFEERVYIQTDVSVNHGNSGGPLINEFGEAIGVVSQKLIGVGTEGIGFCIPSNSIADVLNITFK